jgi:hypothetical protein
VGGRRETEPSASSRVVLCVKCAMPEIAMDVPTHLHNGIAVLRLAMPRTYQL